MQMKYLRVAQLGTFDLDNLGDLLFPLVFDKLLRKVEADFQIKIECDLFGLKGAPAAEIYSDQIECHPIAAFVEKDRSAPYDLIFIGGGDIVREDDDALHSIYGGSPFQFSYPQLLSPLNGLEKRLVLLSPGGPFPLSKAFEIYLQNSFQRLIKASLRDKFSAELISDLVPDTIELEIVPDIVNIIASVFPFPELEYNIQKIIPAEYLRGGYVCFQVRMAFLSDYSKIGGYLLEFRRRTGLQVVLLEIGRCLGDDVILGKIAEDFGFLYIRNDGQQQGRTISIRDKVAVVAYSKAFIGTSLHGNIIARAYGIPYFTFGNSKLAKLAGFFRSTERECFFEGLPELFSSIDEMHRQIVVAEQVLSVEESAAYKSIYSFVRASLALVLGRDAIEYSSYSSLVSEIFLFANEDRLKNIHELQSLTSRLGEAANHNVALHYDNQKYEKQIALGREEKAICDREIHRLQQEIVALRFQIDEITSSRSWLVTKPLRDLRRKLT
jgi:hypothetical protein